MDAVKRGLLLGISIGDGCVQVRQRMCNGYWYEARSLRVAHGPKQRAYCEWKSQRVAWALGKQAINVYPYKNGPNGKYIAYAFSVSHPYFGQIHRWLYPKGKKHYSRQILDMLTPEAVAIWYMDDGSARRNVNNNGWVTSVATDIATMCSQVEAETMVKWFKDRFDIDWRIRYRKASSEDSAFFIQCNTTESRKFIDIIREFIPECMLYKVRHVANLCSHECQTSVGICLACGKTLFDKRRKGLCVRCYTRQHRYKTDDDIVRTAKKKELADATDKEPLR